MKGVLFCIWNQMTDEEISCFLNIITELIVHLLHFISTIYCTYSATNRRKRICL